MNLFEFGGFLSSSQFAGRILENEPLSSHSTMHVGGAAKLFIEPQSEEDLTFVIQSATRNNLDFFILGGGSNTIFPDEGLDLVISTRKLNKIVGEACVHNIIASNARLTVSAGATWGSAITYCKNNNLGGFEPFTGLSGTAGGALYMNATCFGLSACDNLVSAEYLDLTDNKIKTYSKNDADWGYKKSPFQKKTGQAADKIILSATFNVSSGFDEDKSLEVKQKRVSMGHFNAPSAGSAFKNNPEQKIIAGKIIDECGLKGFSIGGARIAPWHGNFIINPDQKATCSDIKALVSHVQKTVLEKTGIQLESEILFV